MLMVAKYGIRCFSLAYELVRLRLSTANSVAATKFSR